MVKENQEKFTLISEANGLTLFMDQKNNLYSVEKVRDSFGRNEKVIMRELTIWYQEIIYHSNKIKQILN